MRIVALVQLLLLLQGAVFAATSPGPPTSKPSSRPSRRPFVKKSVQPTGKPTSEPSFRPSRRPFLKKSVQPTSKPSSRPSRRPFVKKSVQPTRKPSSRPTKKPTLAPSSRPTAKPTNPTAVTVTFSSALNLPGVIPPQTSNEAVLVGEVLKPSLEAVSPPSSVVTITKIGSFTLNNHRRRVQQTNGTSVEFTTVLSSLCTNTGCTSTADALFNESKALLTSAITSGSLTTEIVTTAIAKNITLLTNMTDINLQSLSISDPIIQVVATAQPTPNPSARPSTKPSAMPTFVPTVHPTLTPSNHPIAQPSAKPTNKPTTQPTPTPSNHPIAQPSAKPTTPKPSLQPTARTTATPTAHSITKPSAEPTVQTTSIPTAHPTLKPSIACYDSTGLFAWPSGSSVDCQWVSHHLDNDSCFIAAARINCPSTCGMCSSTTQAPSTAPTRTPTKLNMSMWMNTKVPRAKPSVRVRALLTSSNGNQVVMNSSTCKDSAAVFPWSSGLPVDCQWVDNHKSIGTCSAPIGKKYCPFTCNNCP